MIKSIKIAVLLSLVAAAGFAQSPTPSPTPAMSQQAMLGGSANILKTAGNWTGVESLAQPLITGSFAYAPLQALTDIQNTSNLAIALMGSAISNMQSKQAAHDYLVGMLDYIDAANMSGVALHNYPQAVLESGSAIAMATPPKTEWLARKLLYQARTGLNMNAQIVGFLQSQTSAIDAATGLDLYIAYNPIVATKADLLSFYELLLQSVESNQANAAFIGRVLDQVNKLNE